LLFPLTEINKDQYEFAFFNAIEKHKTDTALEFIDRGVNPDMVKKSKYGLLSALALSIKLNEPKIAVRLIEKGANFINKKGSMNQRYPLLEALRMKQVSVVKAILERDPKIIRREKLTDDFFMLSRSLYKADPDFNVIKMAFQNGLYPSDFKSNGIEILLKAIRTGNLILVEQLLKIGVDPNQPYKMKMALTEAKRYQNPNTNKITDLLILNDATDDYLAVVRKQRSIKNEPNCTIGEKVNLTDLKSQIMNFSKRKLDRMIKQKDGICLSAIALCANDGNGSDDCVKTIKTCKKPDIYMSSEVSTKVNICCSAEFKKGYEKARCSGLNVMETYKWIETR